MYPPLTSKHSRQPAALVPEVLVVLVIPLVKYESLCGAGEAFVTTFGHGCTTSPHLERTSWSIYSHDMTTLSDVNIHYTTHSTIHKLLG